MMVWGNGGGRERERRVGELLDGEREGAARWGRQVDKRRGKVSRRRGLADFG